jgi:glycosyltransferase involved in cell wall biosynthesis
MIEKELRNGNLDIVHIHMSYKGSFIRKYQIHKLCKKYGIPDIIHLHGSEFKKWYDASGDNMKKKIRILLRECDRFIVLGDKWNSIIKKIEPETKTVIVQNTVKIPESTVQWSKEFKILFMGVLIPRKGVADLLQAVSILKLNNQINNMRFIIAGGGNDEDNLKELSRELEIDKYVDFVGWTSGEKKKEIYVNSQMMVLPSYNEGLPMSILEGMSYGLPIVATDVGDISSAVVNGENGYLIHPGDANALAESIYNIYSNKEKYNEMRIKSRRMAEAKFSDSEYFEKMIQTYDEVLKELLLKLRVQIR